MPPKGSGKGDEYWRAWRREYNKRYRQEHLAERREKFRERYRTDPEFRAKHNARVAAYRERRRPALKALVEEAKSAGCAVCGEDEPACLDFHHRDPATKKFHIGAAAYAGGGLTQLERVREEIAKCVVLCANCHRRVHAGLVALPPAS